MDGRSYVMSGSLSDFSFNEVLDVVALSRQHTLVELREPDGSAVASINLKAGHLVRTASDTDDPRDALDRAIRADGSCLFHVYRLSEPTEYQDSGRIADVIEDITKRPRKAKSRSQAAATGRATAQAGANATDDTRKDARCGPDHRRPQSPDHRRLQSPERRVYADEQRRGRRGQSERRCRQDHDLFEPGHQHRSARSSCHRH